MTTAYRTCQAPEGRLLYTVSESGEMLGISRVSAYEFVAWNALDVIRRRSALDGPPKRLMTRSWTSLSGSNPPISGTQRSTKQAGARAGAAACDANYESGTHPKTVRICVGVGLNTASPETQAGKCAPTAQRKTSGVYCPNLTEPLGTQPEPQCVAGP
jgi:hypothetical protein